MNANGDYRPWLREVMDKDNFILIDNDQVTAKDDWRNVAVNKALKYTDAEWLWFTEQDFFPKKDFWELVEKDSEEFNIIGVNIGERLHPCCLFVKREVVNSTSRNFGGDPDRLDHFGLFQEELKNYPIKYLPERVYYHMNGLSQNLYLLQNDQQPNFRLDEFKEYIIKCLEVDNHPDFKNLFEKYLSE